MEIQLCSEALKQYIEKVQKSQKVDDILDMLKFMNRNMEIINRDEFGEFRTRCRNRTRGWVEAVQKKLENNETTAQVVEEVQEQINMFTLSAKC